MRNLFITRGIPGAGKSFLLEKLNLSQFSLSTDQIRQLFSGLTLNPQTGDLSISNEINSAVFSQLYKILELRMSKGETIIVDATHTTTSSFSKYSKLVDKHFYKAYCLDFSDIPEVEF